MGDSNAGLQKRSKAKETRHVRGMALVLVFYISTRLAKGQGYIEKSLFPYPPIMPVSTRIPITIAMGPPISRRQRNHRLLIGFLSKPTKKANTPAKIQIIPAVVIPYAPFRERLYHGEKENNRNDGNNWFVSGYRYQYRCRDGWLYRTLFPPAWEHQNCGQSRYG